ncbi:MAG: hypothetical protein RLY93_17340 [Sumerlaeia bacterium]
MTPPPSDKTAARRVAIPARRHNYWREGAWTDFEAIDARLREDGLILLHDTNDENCKWRGPRFLMQELGEKARDRYQWVNLPTFEGIGLGLLQKRSSLPSPRFQPSNWTLLGERLFHRKYWD